ncbi:DUF4422 domain-containing protein [Levilactobacillus namurensis]|uniref:DUF4422 domain-containing protein n=1 Tax=Levilactobacillus namurensis TaxID=380393 RepID=UPI001D39B40B|nr:DUF4422 domain-containing protein [Levilactobacillus namurensis]HJE45709.1 DUF4422 domain-containing protein [Levilactobacillus namurensis]
MNDFFIGVAGHKPYKMPLDSIYVPIQVGSANKDTIAGYIRDDMGDNISKLNPNYSELTGLYYIWKNVHSRYKGMVHYRRYLKGEYPNSVVENDSSFKKILTADDLNMLLKKTDIILPKKRRYYVETNYSHFIHAHISESLDCTREVIKDSCPEYLNSYEYVLNMRSAHMFNMFIMESTLFDKYCSWLFSILFKLQNKIDINNYVGQEARVFGYVSELLLDVWIKQNQFSYVERPVVYVEGQHLFKKGVGFLKRKCIGHGESHIRSQIDESNSQGEV